MQIYGHDLCTESCSQNCCAGNLVRDCLPDPLHDSVHLLCWPSLGEQILLLYQSLKIRISILTRALKTELIRWLEIAYAYGFIRGTLMCYVVIQHHDLDLYSYTTGNNGRISVSSYPNIPQKNLTSHISYNLKNLIGCMLDVC